MMMQSIHKSVLPIAVLTLMLFIAGCASTPTFDTQQVDTSLTPEAVLDNPAPGNSVLWGGTILDTKNQASTTQIEILAYPLSESQRPLTQQNPLGRFLVNKDGYLEPEIYAQGRFITVMGKLGESRQGKVGESEYRYPVVDAEQLQIWNKPGEASSSNFRFGLGISIFR